VSRTVLGVDACNGGWLAVELRDGAVASWARLPTFERLLDAYPESRWIGVDIPVGLPDGNERAADAAARTFLGPRRSSVFRTFPRSVLEAPTYEDAAAEARRLGWPGLPKQSYAIAERILEVDELHDERVVEVHPEVSFAELAGAPLPASKHTRAGAALRRRLLGVVGLSLPRTVPPALRIDALDAAIAAWSAERYGRRKAKPLPDGHPRGVPGAIWR
jgi:predicted RNase H-like nuclease